MMLRNPRSASRRANQGGRGGLGGPRPASDYDWRTSTSWKRFLNPQNPRSRLVLGGKLAWFPVLGPMLVIAFALSCGSRAHKKFRLGILILILMIMSTFSLWSLVNPKITQHPLGLDLTAPAATDSKAAKIFLLLLYYIGTSVASVAFIIHIYNLSRQEDRALREDLLRRHGTQGTQLRPLPSDNGAYARRARAAVAQSPHPDPSQDGFRGHVPLLPRLSDLHGRSSPGHTPRPDIQIHVPEQRYSPNPREEPTSATSSGSQRSPLSPDNDDIAQVHTGTAGRLVRR